ncbi:hypothetical protein QBC37DRAFT_446282 [Rhypophila decipiens]|uniref:Uncharacterized protein n=1 Tax=Rhypophila decipiens TaxID=261697 RepID=A0AAN7B627_9PEZI|nr:hypothetical protein QBC37DRAFT_446282 [Rhypophila decipiens]
MEDMSVSYGNVGPGGPANVHYPQKARRQESVNSTRPSWMQPTLLQENALQPTRTRDATSQLAKSNSELDWLGQGTSDAAGKNPVPIKRPDRGTQNETHVGPFGPSNASISAKAHNTAPANRQNPDIPQKNPPSTFQPVGGTNDQGQTLSGADHSTTNFTPFSPLKNHHGKPDDVTPNNIRPKPFDAVHDPSDPSKKDIIFRMSMPIVEDFQPGLDEFCRLRRLGHFEDAEQQFQYTLKNLQGMPYVLVQYCEMLLAAGRYTSFRAVSYRKKYASLESEESVKDPCLDMLEGNFWLLDRLAKVPLPAFSVDIFEAINETLMALRSESAMGSTAIQILVLCLTILGHLRVSLGDSVTGRINYYHAVLDWNQLYHRLLGENRIWDLRDLLVAAGSLFGPQFLTQCLDVKSFSLALDRLLEDWMQPEYDESTNLGLLDLFTSLLLERPSSIKDDPKAALLLEHAKSLAESIQVNDTQNI